MRQLARARLLQLMVVMTLVLSACATGTSAGHASAVATHKMIESDLSRGETFRDAAMKTHPNTRWRVYWRESCAPLTQTLATALEQLEFEIPTQSASELQTAVRRGGLRAKDTKSRFGRFVDNIGSPFMTDAGLQIGLRADTRPEIPRGFLRYILTIETKGSNVGWMDYSTDLTYVTDQLRAQCPAVEKGVATF